MRDVRRAGCASIDLARVADGTYDGYYEIGLHPWDFAAAALVVTEAGGLVGGLPQEDIGERMAIAANPMLFGQLQQLVAEGMSAATRVACSWSGKSQPLPSIRFQGVRENVETLV